MKDYKCTISTIRMVNELLVLADPLPDPAIALVEVTYFCRDILLDAIWNHLRFEHPTQFWEILAVTFEHFLICVGRLTVDPFVATSTDALVPGQIVLAGAQNGRAIHQAMRSCAARIYAEQNAQHFAAKFINTTILNLLDLMNAILEAEASSPQQPSSFSRVLLADKDLIQKILLGSVDDSLPPQIQVAAIQLMRNLYGSQPDAFVTLDSDVQSTLLRALGRVYDHSLHF